MIVIEGPYAIFRLEKRKVGQIRQIEMHNERLKEEYASNPDIDPDRMKDNYHLVHLQDSQMYSQAIRKRIRQVGCKTRKDSIVMIDTVVTASPDWIKGLSSGDQQKFFMRAAEFCKTEFGSDNVLSAVVHMDEATPHMHVCVVPITSDGRLSAKDIVGNKAAMSRWQTRYHDWMAEIFPTLKRGKPAVQTEREHLPTWVIKQSGDLDRQGRDLIKKINEATPLTINRVKREVVNDMGAWVQQTEILQAQIASVQAAVQERDELRIKVSRLTKALHDMYELYRSLIRELVKLQDDIRRLAPALKPRWEEIVAKATKAITQER